MFWSGDCPGVGQILMPISAGHPIFDHFKPGPGLWKLLNLGVLEGILGVTVWTGQTLMPNSARPQDPDIDQPWTWVPKHVKNEGFWVGICDDRMLKPQIYREKWKSEVAIITLVDFGTGGVRSFGPSGRGLVAGNPKSSPKSTLKMTKFGPFYNFSITNFHNPSPDPHNFWISEVLFFGLRRGIWGIWEGSKSGFGGNHLRRGVKG